MEMAAGEGMCVWRTFGEDRDAWVGIEQGTQGWFGTWAGAKMD